MAFTYTSVDLANLQVLIPEHAATADLVVIPGVSVLKEIDVAVDSEEVDIYSVLKIAVLVNAAFISVSSTSFSLDRIRMYFEAEHGEELPPEAERVLKANADREDALMSLTVSWVAQGLAYEWSADCGWAGELMEKVAAVLENTEATSEAEREERLRRHYSHIQAAVTALAESPKYRGEQVNKRRHIASAIIAQAGLDDVDEVTLSHQVIPGANKIVNGKAHDFEERFRVRKSELVAELAAYPAWRRETTKSQKKLATVKFLMEKADGYRLTSSNFAEELSEAALSLGT